MNSIQARIKADLNHWGTWLRPADEVAAFLDFPLADLEATASVLCPELIVRVRKKTYFDQRLYEIEPTMARKLRYAMLDHLAYSLRLRGFTPPDIPTWLADNAHLALVVEKGGNIHHGIRHVVRKYKADAGDKS